MEEALNSSLDSVVGPQAQVETEMVPSRMPGADKSAEDSLPFPALDADALKDPLMTLSPPKAEPKANALADADAVAKVDAPSKSEPEPHEPLAAVVRSTSHLQLVREDSVSEVTEFPDAPPEDAAASRAFGTNPPAGAPEGPAPHPEIEDWTPPLRRQESVIEEAEDLRHHHRAKLRNLSNRVRALTQTGGPQISRAGVSFASRIGETAFAALRRFEKLPRSRQLLWVAAPYCGAIVLAFALFAARSANETPIQPTSDTVELETQAPATPKAPVAAIAPKAEVPIEPETQAPAPVDVVPEVAVAAASEAPAAQSSEPITLSRKSKLFVRADAKSKRPIGLRKGTQVTVFADFPAPEGWRLVQTKKGSVGFVSTLHLEGKKDPRIDKKRRRRRSRR